MYFKKIENLSNNNYLFALCLFVFCLIIQEPSYKLFGSEIHYMGEALQKVINYYPSQYSAYFQNNNLFSYRMIFDLLTSGIHLLTDNIILTANIGRLILALLFTLSIFHFSKSLEMNMFTTIGTLSFFMLMNQQLVGGDRIFGNGFQSSAISYSFVILSISFYLRNNIKYFIFYSIVSTFLHFIIGGYWFAFCLIALFYQDKNINNFIKNSLIYLFFCLPLLLSLYFDIFDNQSNINQVNDIFAFRSKHHVFPFYSFSTFLWWIPGLIFTFVYLIYSITAILNNYEKKLNLLIIIGSFQIFIFLIISFFDKSYFLGNIFPFRSSSVILLLTFFSIFKRVSSSNINFFLIFTVVFTVSLNVIYPALGRIIFDNPESLKSGKDNSKENLYKYIKTNTKLNDVIVRVNNSNDLSNLEIITQRPTYVHWKIIPTTSKLAIEWWGKYNLKNKLNYNNCKNIEYNFINYIIVDPQDLSEFQKCGTAAYSNNKFTVIQLND